LLERLHRTYTGSLGVDLPEEVAEKERMQVPATESLAIEQDKGLSQWLPEKGRKVTIDRLFIRRLPGVREDNGRPVRSPSRTAASLLIIRFAWRHVRQ
jgi:hypothetical protein